MRSFPKDRFVPENISMLSLSKCIGAQAIQGIFRGQDIMNVVTYAGPGTTIMHSRLLFLCVKIVQAWYEYSTKSS